MSNLIATERTAERLLMILKTRGAQTTRALADALEISVPGVQQHLNRLLQDELVQSHRQAGGVGRPALRWSLTELALEAVSGYARAAHGDADRLDPPQPG